MPLLDSPLSARIGFVSLSSLHLTFTLVNNVWDGERLGFEKLSNLGRWLACLRQSTVGRLKEQGILFQVWAFADD